MKKFLYIWLFRITGFIFVAFIITGVVNALSGQPITKLIEDIIFPFTWYHSLMPVMPDTWEGWKFIYAGITLILELFLLAGVIVMVYDLIRLGKSQFSDAAMTAMAQMLSQIEKSVREAWGLQPHECRFYWLAGINKNDGYDYYTGRHQHLDELDKRVIADAMWERASLVEEPKVKQKYATHHAEEYVFIRNVGELIVGAMVFINKQGIVTQSNVNIFKDLVEPIISLDGTKEIVVELSKKRGVIVV